MIKKFLLLSVVASQLMISCSSEDNPSDPTPESKPETEQTLQEQIAALLKQPYSNLTPAQQKQKLEAEANEMLVQLDKTKSSGAIEALENLNNLLQASKVDIFNGKNDNKVEDILQVSGVYGIYTWNNTNKVWVKTASTTELKFVFPAKKSQTANNATFSAKSVSSDVKVKYTDYNGNWSYDDKTNTWTLNDHVNDYFFLPTSSDAVLTIEGTQSATFVQTAKYANGKEVPTDFSYKMVLNDGYTWEMSSVKAVQNTAKASLTYNGKTLIDFNGGSNAEIDKLLDNQELVQYRGKANGLFKLMDNFILVADTDLAELAKGEETIEKTFSRPDRATKTFYTDLNTYNLKYAEAQTANSNKNTKLILVSKKDGTKIADVIYRTEPGYSFKSSEYESWVADASNVKYGGSWVFDWNNGVPKGTAVKIQEYDQVLYLKFNDNTEAAFSVYFSEGFDKLQAKVDDFLAAFNRK